MKKIMLSIILMSIFSSGCVLATGKDKERLSSQTVWANQIYVIYMQDKIDGKTTPPNVIEEWLDINRKTWALFDGACEGLSADEILAKLPKPPTGNNEE